MRNRVLIAVLALLTVVTAGCAPIPAAVPQGNLAQITFVFEVGLADATSITGVTIDSVIDIALEDPTLNVIADGRNNPAEIFPLESHRVSPYRQNILVETGALVQFFAKAHIRGPVGYIVKCWVENISGSRFPGSFGSAAIFYDTPKGPDGLADVTAVCQYLGGA